MSKIPLFSYLFQESYQRTNTRNSLLFGTLASDRVGSGVKKADNLYQSSYIEPDDHLKQLVR